MKSTQFLSSLVLVSGSLAAPAPASPRSFKVPIRRGDTVRSNGPVDGPAVLQSLDWTLRKYGHAGLSLPSGVNVKSLAKRDGAVEKLYDHYGGGVDSLYIGDISIRGMTFSCPFDTGSSDLFVPGVNCTEAQGCITGARYDSGGIDLGNRTNVTYGTGDVSGENWLDNVTVAGLTAIDQNVIVAETEGLFLLFGINSLCGMAFDSNAASKKPTFFSTLMSQGAVAADEFSFYLGRGADGTGNCSELTLGGRDESKLNGALTTLPISVQKYWQTNLDAVKVGDQTINATSGLQAIHDTGTTAIIAPVPAAQAISAALGGYNVSGDQLYAFPCNNTKTVDFVLGGRAFSVNAKDLSFGALTTEFLALVGAAEDAGAAAKAASEYCLSAVMGEDLLPGGATYILGDAFLKGRYSVYSYSASNGAPAILLGDSVSSGVAC